MLQPPVKEPARIGCVQSTVRQCISWRKYVISTIASVLPCCPPEWSAVCCLLLLLIGFATFGGHDSSVPTGHTKAPHHPTFRKRLPREAEGPVTALVVRGYNPSDAMVNRWQQFARSCRDTSATRPYYFSVSLDVTNRSRADDVARMRPIMDEGGGVHTYTTSKLLRSFPGLKQLASQYTNLTKRPYKVGRFAVIEPILLWHYWVRTLNVSEGSGALAQRTLAWLWIFEQDVAASHPIALVPELLARYASVRADLITALPINESRFVLKARNQGSTGFHAAVRTPAFARAFPRPAVQLRTASIFVQRWSAALANVLEESTRGHSMHAWAEIATPSLCRRANLTIAHLFARHRGALFHACCTKHVKTTSHNFLPDEARFVKRVNQSVVKLYHPVKF